MTGSFSPIKNAFGGKDIVSIDQFDRASFETILKTTKTISEKINSKAIQDLLKGKIITLIFF